MCIFLAGDQGLDETHILVAPVFVRKAVAGSRLLQFTAYQNRYTQPSGGAPRIMILPVPSYSPDAQDDIRFMEPPAGSENLLGNVFGRLAALAEVRDEDEESGRAMNELLDLLPEETSRSFTLAADAMESSAPEPVVQVGDYKVTVIHRIEDLVPERLDEGQLGVVAPGALTFLREKYSSDEEMASMNLGEVSWKFLVCRADDKVTQPRPICYVHSLHSTELIGARDLRLQNMFIPTVHYHPAEHTNALVEAEFNHRITVLLGNTFAGAGAGVSSDKSLQQKHLRRHTIYPTPHISELDPDANGDELISVFVSQPYDVSELLRPLKAAFPRVQWPTFTYPYSLVVGAPRETDVLLYDIQADLPNKDIYVGVNPSLTAFARA